MKNPDLTKSLSHLPALYETDGVKGDLPAVYVFTPDANATWVLWEFDPETRTAFGLCDLGVGFPEIGYVSVHELELIRGRFGLPVEIDKFQRTRFAGYRNAGVPVPSFLEA